MKAGEWLSAALSVKGADKAFKLVKVDVVNKTTEVLHVLHRESGAIWKFTCETVREEYV